MNWIELKALNDIYKYGEKKLNQTLIESYEINFLLNSVKVLDKSSKKLVALDGFCKEYEEKYFKKFNTYEAFLIENELLKIQTRFDEEDIKTLMKISSLRDNGNLDELRKQIIESDESVRGVSQMFFRNDKYLDSKPSLVNALKKILEVEHFSNEKDQQYIYKLECRNPTVIVLCENLDFLTKPNKPRQHGIELWYAGGKNVTKLDYADTRGLPIYYSCDWDFDGLFVIYPLVKEKIPTIKLLTPNGVPKGIIETEHKSRWGNTKYMRMDFILTNDQQLILKKLVEGDQWIIEESCDLLEMVVNSLATLS